MAVIGLAVNLLSEWLIHDHEHHDDHDGHHHHDLNLRAAYLHVLADALTQSSDPPAPLPASTNRTPR